MSSIPLIWWIGFNLFVGVKMALAHTPWKIDTMVSLGVVATILAASVLASVIHQRSVPLRTENNP